MVNVVVRMLNVLVKLTLLATNVIKIVVKKNIVEQY